MKYATITGCLMLIATLLAGCSKPTDFTVKGKTESGDDLTVYMTYYDGSAMRREEASTLKGEFHLRGRSMSPALLTFTDADHRQLTQAIASNGDEISLTIDTSEPVNSRAKGNKPTEMLSDFMADNAGPLVTGDTRAVNAAVGKFIADHPDSPASTALLTSVFSTPGHEEQADSLLRLLTAKARSRAILGTYPTLLAMQLGVDATANITTRTLPGTDRDHSVRLNPRKASLTLLAFGTSQTLGTDSAEIILRDLTERWPDTRLQAIELSGAPDSLTWAVGVRRDSTAKWQRTWTPYTTADRQWKSYAIPARPFFIVSDSTGTMRLRTRSAAEAQRFIDAFLN